MGMRKKRSNRHKMSKPKSGDLKVETIPRSVLTDILFGKSTAIGKETTSSATKIKSSEPPQKADEPSSVTCVNTQDKSDQHVYDDNILTSVDTMKKWFNEHDVVSKMTNEEKQVVLIICFEQLMEDAGVARHVTMAGGKFEEILCAFQRKGVVSKAKTGPDLFVVDKDGKMASNELKTSNVKLGEKTNFHFTPPIREKGESMESYKKRFFEAFESKGKITCRHKHSSLSHTDYQFDYEFIANLVWYKAGKDGKEVNIGAVSCKKCKGVHRLDYYTYLNKLWTATTDKTAFDWSLVNVTKSQSICVVYQ